MVILLYLDNAATTKVLPEVEREILSTIKYYGNPSSIHAMGEQSQKIIKKSRTIISSSINASPTEIIFTSSGTEADNLALKGFYFANTGYEIVTSPIEHKAILNSCKFLSSIGAKIHYVDINNEGKIDLEDLKNICLKIQKNNNKPFVSIQFANNEIGTIQDIKTLSSIIHNYNGVFHTDAVQAFPEIKIDVKALNIDMLSVSGHKIGTPKGIGFLYIKRGLKLEPIIHGGQQEFSLRAGTENLPYIAGLAKAVQLIDYNSVIDMKNLRDYIIKRCIDEFGNNIIINGSSYRLANNISISFKHTDGEALSMLLSLKNIYVSTGSACNSLNIETSYVLKEINVDKDYILGTIRISLSNMINYKHADLLLETLKESFNTLLKLRN